MKFLLSLVLLSVIAKGETALPPQPVFSDVTWADVLRMRVIRQSNNLHKDPLYQSTMDLCTADYLHFWINSFKRGGPLNAARAIDDTANPLSGNFNLFEYATKLVKNGFVSQHTAEILSSDAYQAAVNACYGEDTFSKNTFHYYYSLMDNASRIFYIASILRFAGQRMIISATSAVKKVTQVVAVKYLLFGMTGFSLWWAGQEYRAAVQEEETGKVRQQRADTLRKLGIKTDGEKLIDEMRTSSDDQTITVINWQLEFINSSEERLRSSTKLTEAERRDLTTRLREIKINVLDQYETVKTSMAKSSR